MLKVDVALKEKSYPILVGKDILKDTGRFFKKRGAFNSHVLIVSQKEIAALYGKLVTDSLAKEGFQVSSFIVPVKKSSEEAKSHTVFWNLIRGLASLDGKGKTLALLALGGGVMGDLTGFAAAVYRRGIPYVQVPTTLTAQVDSAIGGKTAIDLPQGKNLLGVIYQPFLVLSDTAVLGSLPDRHWSDGFAEVIKYGVIKDPLLFTLLEKHGLSGIRANAGLLENVIFRCAKIKARIVERDESDKKDIRITLNFGHTAGHAIESVSGFSKRYTHGEAVAIGMLVATDIAARLGVLKDTSLAKRLEKTLVKFSLPLFYKGLSEEAILKAISYDKKTQDGKNRFVLPVTLGKVLIRKDVPSAVIMEALRKRKG